MSPNPLSPLPPTSHDRDKADILAHLRTLSRRGLAWHRGRVLKTIDRLNAIHAQRLAAGEVTGKESRPGLMRAQLELECLNEVIGDA